MQITYLDTAGNPISFDKFFSTHPEFLSNEKLRKQRTRFLRTLTRHASDAPYIAEPRGCGYEFEFSGEKKKYVLEFHVKNGAVVLTALR